MKVVITGAHSDLSQSMYKHLSVKGHQVYLTSHSKTPEEKFIPFDLTKPALFENEMDQLLAQNPECLILNAATPTYRIAKTADIDWQQLDQFIQANVQGNLWILRKFLPIFEKQKMGRIVFISSMNNQFPIMGYIGYAMAKSALETAMKYVAYEYGAANVTANTLRLGVIHTSRNDKFVRRDSIREKMESAVSLKRLGKPDDINLSLDALIDPNCFIQGTTIEVSGGPSL